MKLGARFMREQSQGLDKLKLVSTANLGTYEEVDYGDDIIGEMLHGIEVDPENDEKLASYTDKLYMEPQLYSSSFDEKEGERYQLGEELESLSLELSRLKQKSQKIYFYLQEVYKQFDIE